MRLSRGIYNGYKTSTDADRCGHHSAHSCFPVSRDDAGGMSHASLQRCSQQPWKEPSIKASHMLSKPILSVKKAASRQGAAAMLRANPALSRVKAANARTISILIASLMMAFRLCLLRLGQPRCSPRGNLKCLRLPKHFFRLTIGFLGTCHLSYRLRSAYGGLADLSLVGPQLLHPSTRPVPV